MTIREVNGRKIGTHSSVSVSGLSVTIVVAIVTVDANDIRYNVRNFVYVRRHPFNPRRLFELLHDRFILQHPIANDEDEEDAEGDDEDEEDEDIDYASSDSDSEADNEDTEMAEVPELPSDSIVLANKRAHPLFAKLFRFKGELWLATRPGRAGEWCQAGAMLTPAGGRPWFCTIPRYEWETGIAKIDQMVEHDMKEGRNEATDGRSLCSSARGLVFQQLKKS